MVANLPCNSVDGRARCTAGEPMKRSAGGCDNRRTTFSTRMTVASTTRPKSIAPTESKFADFAAQQKQADRERQGEGDRRGDDQRTAQIAQKQPLQDEDEDDAVDHVVQYRVRGDVYQVGAVIDLLQYARRAAEYSIG